MSNLFVAVRCFDGEPDAIVFRTYSECARFCVEHPEYERIETGVYTLDEALSLFPAEA